MVKRALLIGINYNSVPDLTLNGCINDAILMRNVLIDAYNYDRENIVMLRDDGLLAEYEMPNKANIIDNLKTLCSLTKENDELWIHYSGHGTFERDKNSDEVDRYDEVIIPLDYNTNGSISDDELKAILETAGGTVFISQDCCNSGTGWDLPFRFVVDSADRVALYRESNAMSNTNIYMFSASRDDQLAMDTYSADIVRNIGAFTNALVECLREGKHNNNLITLKTDINNYLEKGGYDQRSEFTSSNRTPNNVVLTRNGITNKDPPSVRVNTARPLSMLFL